MTAVTRRPTAAKSPRSRRPTRNVNGRAIRPPTIIAPIHGPGHAELLAQAKARDDVDAGVDEQRDDVVQLRAAHQAVAPSTPPGRTAITISSTPKAITSLYDG